MKTHTQTINLDFLSEFAKGDKAKMHRYIEMYLKTAPMVVDEFESLLDEKSFETLKLKAHSIKPQMQYMGIPELRDALVQIEAAVSDEEYDDLPGLIDQAKSISSKASKELSEYLQE